MTYAAALVRIFCAPMLLASSAVIAAPTQFSEQLADWRNAATTKIAAVASTAQAPLALVASTNVGESIIRELVLLKGHAMLGTRYVFGANEADAVDCSSLIQQLFESAGIELPRTTQDLASIGEPVNSQSLQPGDLLFYSWKKNRLHVAVYAGDGFAIHASPDKRSVVMTELNKVWDKHFIAARRVVQEDSI
ncbi:MAG: C40 family peptidase [Pseudomonadota bacterium]